MSKKVSNRQRIPVTNGSIYLALEGSCLTFWLSSDDLNVVWLNPEQAYAFAKSLVVHVPDESEAIDDAVLLKRRDKYALYWKSAFADFEIRLHKSTKLLSLTIRGFRATIPDQTSMHLAEVLVKYYKKYQNSFDS